MLSPHYPSTLEQSPHRALPHHYSTTNFLHIRPESPEMIPGQHKRQDCGVGRPTHDIRAFRIQLIGRRREVLRHNMRILSFPLIMMLVMMLMLVMMFRLIRKADLCCNLQCRFQQDSIKPMRVAAPPEWGAFRQPPDPCTHRPFLLQCILIGWFSCEWKQSCVTRPTARTVRT